MKETIYRATFRVFDELAEIGRWWTSKCDNAADKAWSAGKAIRESVV